MHIQPEYALDLSEARRLIAEHGWARVVTYSDGALRATYGYFLLDDDDERVVVRGHFSGEDPQAADIERRSRVLLIFDGPHGYISASWYRPVLTNTASTWNHISVHVHGVAEPLEGDDALDVLRRTLDQHEAEETDPWRLEGESLTRARGLVAGVRAFRLRADRVEAKAKMSQDKPRAVITRVIETLDRPGPHANSALADTMRRVNAP
ncbi:MAG: FMN-binding negative transcriptional regulator [Candidatus Dormibacteria bacterium]